MRPLMLPLLMRMIGDLPLSLGWASKSCNSPQHSLVYVVCCSMLSFQSNLILVSTAVKKRLSDALWTDGCRCAAGTIARAYDSSNPHQQPVICFFFSLPFFDWLIKPRYNCLAPYTFQRVFCIRGPQFGGRVTAAIRWTRTAFSYRGVTAIISWRPRFCPPIFPPPPCYDYNLRHLRPSMCPFSIMMAILSEQGRQGSSSKRHGKTFRVSLLLRCSCRIVTVCLHAGRKPPGRRPSPCAAPLPHACWLTAPHMLPCINTSTMH